MSGYVAMRRDWQNHGMFVGDEFSRRDAWAWLIANAMWKPTKARIKGSMVDLGRGEMCFSVRFLAEKWGWSKSRADRFLAGLRAEGMIETRSKTGTTAGHSAGQGQTIISVCNYDKFQAPLKGSRDNDEAENGPRAGQQRDKEEEGNKGTNEPEEGSGRADRAESGYSFSGEVIRLTHAHFDRWTASYPDLDLRAVLQSRDDWLARQTDEKVRDKWFLSTSSYLANLQQKATAAARESEGMRVPC